MSFALANQSKNSSRDSKTSTSVKHSSTHHHINNLNNGSSDYLIHLQRTVGNQAVQRLVRSKNNNNSAKGFDFEKIGILQPKLKVSQPGDEYEQEADKVAEQVMRMSVSSDSTITSSYNQEHIDRKCAACEMEKEKEDEEQLNISRKPSTVSFNLEEDDEITNGIDNIRSSSGSSLDSDTRDFMESRFGYDFSNVRIHAGESAARSSDDISALAYTIGNDIVFGREQYQPTTAHGRRLLAHELTHIVQQQGIFNHFNVIQRSRREEQNVSEILEQEEKFPDLYISAQISSQDFAESGAPEEGSSEEAMSTSSCPLTAVFLSTIVGPEKAGCQVPSGYHGASRLARFRIIGSKANDAKGSLTVGEQFNVLDDPFGVIGLVHPNTYKTSAGIFDDCYMLYSPKPLPFNFVLKIEQNHLINGQIVSKNHITYTPDHVSFCSFQRLPGKCEFGGRCRI